MPRRESKWEFSNAVCWLLGHGVDGKLIRNLYQRTVRLWIEGASNRWRFRNFNRDWERRKKRFHLYLDEQLEKSNPREPKT